jgi:hypothetical protein|tara:strand:- start:1344 stop:1652 length:309 start_codon:yes stop_codon:yes gene_type:complete
MRMTKHQLFTIEGEILDSMKTPASKETIRKLYVALGNASGQWDAISPKYFLQRLEYLIRMGHSSIENIDKVKEMYDFKLYYEKNKDEMSDYYENKNVNTNTR